MREGSTKFAALFKKYRLRAEFATWSELSLALAEKGFIYEDSILSRWQKGERIPGRVIVLKLIEIFVERKAIATIDQVNDFLSSVGQGYLSEEELQKIPITLPSYIFQVPSEIENFVGREEVISKLKNTKNIKGKVIFIHGVAGVGKTALAIKIGHLFKNKFTDGVLWYKIEQDNLKDILLSIARIFGEDISTINNLQVRATVVRSLLSSKNVLIIFDSAELSEDINLLIPNSKFCTTVITSQNNYLRLTIPYLDIPLKPFVEKEVLSLFKKILVKKYETISRNRILNIAKRVGNIPLSVHLLARELLYTKIPLEQLPVLIKNEDKNLYSTIAMSYEKLDIKMKSILISASIFKGKDFSAKSLGYINGLSVSATTVILKGLIDLSLVEYSTKNRYRIHPAIQEFVRDKLNYPRSSNLIIIAILIFSFFTLWWVYLQLFLDKSDIMYKVFSATYGVMALYGGICGIHISQRWGGLKTLLGKAIFMFACGLFSQELGQIIYTYLDLTNQKLYPSLGDIGFFGTIPFYIYGTWLLAGSAGIKINIQSFQKKIIALVIPITMLTVSYFIFLQDYIFDWKDPIKIFLDFGYPFGDALYISIAIIIFIFSRNILDGIMRSKALFILIALFFEFIADDIFAFKSSSFYAGGDIDFLFLIAYFAMTIALLNLKSLQVKIKNI